MAPHGRSLPTTPVATRAATHRVDRGNNEASTAAAAPSPQLRSPSCVRACVRPERATPPPSLTPRDFAFPGHTPSLASATVRPTAAGFSSRVNTANRDTGKYLSSPATAKSQGRGRVPVRGGASYTPRPAPRGSLGNSSIGDPEVSGAPSRCGVGRRASAARHQAYVFWRAPAGFLRKTETQRLQGQASHFLSNSYKIFNKRIRFKVALRR